MPTEAPLDREGGDGVIGRWALGLLHGAQQGCWVLGVGCWVAPAAAQTTPPSSPTPLLRSVQQTQRPITQSPNHPPYLPPFSFEGGKGTLRGETRPDGTVLLVIEGGAVFTMGDLRVEADRISWDRLAGRIEAKGHVLALRGDESLRGDDFFFESANRTLGAGNAVIISAPFSIRTKTLSGQNGEITLASPRIGVGPGQEFAFFAEEASLRGMQNNATLSLRNATFSLLGMRLLTLRHLSFPLQSQRRRSGSAGLNALFSVRHSSISGLGVSVGLPFTLSRGVYGTARTDLTTRGGIQPIVTLRHDFFGPLPQTQRLVFALPGAIDPTLADASPIRQWVTARPLPPPYESILDYADILPEPNLLSRPTRALERDGFIEANISSRRELNGGRRGPVLFSRLPEIAAGVRFPLAPPIPAANNEATLQFLRTPRLTVRGEASAGRYREIQAQEPGDPHVTASRSRILLGVGVAPYLIGAHTLLTAETSAHIRRYSGNQEYRVMESNVAAQYVFAARSAVGAAYIRRSPQGETPFLSDEIDARHEVQLRSQYALPGGKYTLASLARYDADDRHFFDFQFAVAYRQGVVEPRLAYRTLNRQILFTVAFPGLTER